MYIIVLLILLLLHSFLPAMHHNSLLALNSDGTEETIDFAATENQNNENHDSDLPLFCDLVEILLCKLEHDLEADKNRIVLLNPYTNPAANNTIACLNDIQTKVKHLLSHYCPVQSEANAYLLLSMHEHMSTKHKQEVKILDQSDLTQMFRNLTINK